MSNHYSICCLDPNNGEIVAMHLIYAPSGLHEVLDIATSDCKVNIASVAIRIDLMRSQSDYEAFHSEYERLNNSRRIKAIGA